MELDRVCKKLIIKEPFWGLFMVGLNKTYSTLVPTLGVRKLGIGVELLINKDFWNTLSDTEQMAVLLHELHHISLGHIFMSSDFSNHEKFNIAADAEVNCYIKGLPDGHIDVHKLGLPEKMGVKWYYNHLPQFDNNNSSGSLESKLIDDHSNWEDFSNVPDIQKELIQNQIDTQLKQAAELTIKQNGTIPGCLKDIIKILLTEKPRIYNWKSHFRRMLGTAIDVSFKKTYQRESKRFNKTPGIKLKRKVHILVAIDTSGSIHNTELLDFFNEIHHIYKTKAKITIIECDSKIQSIWEYKGSQEIKITGRGGTDFKPAIDYYRDNIKEYSMFVFFTDGYAPIDNLNVPNNNMLWLITSNGRKQEYPGKTVYIPENH